MNALEEQAAECPYCGEPITLLIDCTQGRQDYVEDCPICCQPMVVHVDCTQEDTIRIGLECENA